MNESFFTNLPFGKVFLCYNPAEQLPHANDVKCVLEVVSAHMPNFVVDVLATDAHTAGMLVARRFNLGVVSGAYGVLVAPAYPGVALSHRAEALVKGLLDVDSFRNEPVLYLDKLSMSETSVFLDACGTVLEEVSTTHFSHPFHLFWQSLRKEADDVDYCVEHIKRESMSGAVSSPTFIGLGCIVNELDKVLKPSKKESSECSKSVISYEMQEESSDFCAEVAESIPTYGGDNTDDVLSEQEALAKQIAALVRLYILKYGAIDNDRIASLLQGKMVLRSDKLSNLVVNRDCKIILPDYDEVELNLGGPLHKSLYIFFLMHPEGVTVKEVAAHIGELEDIYTIVAPNFNSEPVYRLNDSKRVTQSISKINKVIKSVLPIGDLAGKYTIEGGRNMPYSIAVAAMEGKVNVMPKF